MGALKPTKQCSRCKYSKNRPEFSLAKRSKDGLQAWCKSCDAAYKTDSGYTKRLQELHKEAHDDAFYRLAYSDSGSKRCSRRTGARVFELIAPAIQGSSSVARSSSPLAS